MERISVVEPVGPAIERVKAVLFRPFNFEHWIAIAFCAWLAELVGGGFQGNFNPGGFDHHKGGGPKLPPEVMNFIHQYWPIILGVGIVLAVFIIALVVVLLWLSSRGRFMFLNCVAKNRADIVDPWHRYGRAANQLFVFRLVVGLIGIVMMLAIMGVAMGTWYFVSHAHGFGGFRMVEIFVPMIILAILIGVPLAIIFAVVFKFTKDFAVPIMYLRGVGIMEAWRQINALIRGRAGTFILYILFQIVLAMAIGLMVLILVFFLCCCTCCIGLLLFCLPFVSTAVLLPVLVFGRAYSLYFLRQFGPEYDAFLAA